MQSSSFTKHLYSEKTQVNFVISRDGLRRSASDHVDGCSCLITQGSAYMVLAADEQVELD